MPKRMKLPVRVEKLFLSATVWNEIDRADAYEEFKDAFITDDETDKMITFLRAGFTVSTVSAHYRMISD